MAAATKGGRAKADPAAAFAEASKRARANLNKPKARTTGVQNAKPGFEYYWFCPSELKAYRARRLRDTLREKGFLPVDTFGDPDDWPDDWPHGAEYISSARDAEIWAIREEDAAEWFAKRVARREEKERARKPDTTRRTEEILRDLENPSILAKLRDKLGI